MEMIPVKSSNILEIGYDATKLIFEVKFVGGGHYRYQGVPATRWATMLAETVREGGSVGKVFAREIRANHKGELLNPV